MNRSEPRVDRSQLSVVGLHEEGDDRAYWWSKTPQERFEAIELMRQINYGYDPATIRIERVLEFAQLGDI